MYLLREIGLFQAYITEFPLAFQFMPSDNKTLCSCRYMPNDTSALQQYIVCRSYKDTRKEKSTVK